MQPYLYSDNNKNIISCNCDLLITDDSKPLMISLLDLNILNKKICSDLIQGKSIYLKDREDVNYSKYFYSRNDRYRYKSDKQGELTHTIIYNTDIDNYIIDWNNEGDIKVITRWLNNKKYMPITEDIIEKIIKMDREEAEKQSYHNFSVYKECEVYSSNPEFKSLKCYKVNEHMIRNFLNRIDLEGIQDDFNWDSIETIEDYILTFIEPIKDKLKENIKVLYNPNNINQTMFEGKKKPFDGQIPIIQSAIEVLKKNRFIYIAAEQGIGKSPMTAKVINSYYNEINKKNPIVFIIAPAITLTQWKQELKDCINDKIDIITIKKTDEFIQLYSQTNFKVNNPTFILCGKETFKLQYKLKPAINIKTQRIKKKEIDEYWGRRYSRSNLPDWAINTVEVTSKVLTCPDCGIPLKNPLQKKEDVFFTEKDFAGNPKKSNYKCQNCGSILWQATYDKTRKTSVIDFIKRKKIKFDCVVVDECQEGNNSESIIGSATRTIIRNHAKKVILLSGTPNNGYASSLYNILFALMPNKLFENNIADEKAFINHYGTLQAITKKNDDKRYYYSRGRAEIKESDFFEIEGINPLVFTKYLSQNFIVADLMDLGKDLPPFNEYYVPIQQLDELLITENRLLNDIKEVNAFNAKMYVDSIVKHYINNPFKWKGIPIENGEKFDIVQPYNIDEIILPKEQELMNIVNKELKENRKCWIYVDFNNGGEYMEGESIPNRIERLLKEQGIKVFQLKPSVKTYDRKEVIDSNKDKYDVFISNRKLVEVGLNLQFCPTYINYMPSYMVNNVEQSCRRGWRANSTLENRVYHLYYKNTCEHGVIERYQRKKAESNAILGRFNVKLETEGIRTASKFSSAVNKSIS